MNGVRRDNVEVPEESQRPTKIEEGAQELEDPNIEEGTEEIQEGQREHEQSEGLDTEEASPT